MKRCSVGQHKIPHEKSGNDKFGYKLKNSSFKAGFTPVQQAKSHNARLRKIRELAATIPNQGFLDNILLEFDDRLERQQAYELYLPYLKFESHCP